jgi:hypothetical protein
MTQRTFFNLRDAEGNTTTLNLDWLEVLQMFRGFRTSHKTINFRANSEPAVVNSYKSAVMYGWLEPQSGTRVPDEGHAGQFIATISDIGLRALARMEDVKRLNGV